jgi:predicted nucleotidyltransferase
VDIAEPTRSLSPTLHLAVLAVLARLEQPVSGRGLARRLEGKASQRGVSDVLNYLVAQGLVVREDHPPSASFSLNRDHVAAGIAELLGGLKETLRQRCASEIEAWAVHPEWAALFGSLVRGEGDASSDIDLVLVVPDDCDVHGDEWASQIDRLDERVRSWTGNPASIVVFGLGEYLASDEPLALEIAHEAITLWGERPARRPR